VFSVLGNCVVVARVNSFCATSARSVFLTAIRKMTAVVDAQSQEPPAIPSADELKVSLAAGSAGDSNLGIQRWHVLVCLLTPKFNGISLFVV